MGRIHELNGNNISVFTRSWNVSRWAGSDVKYVYYIPRATAIKTRKGKKKIRNKETWKTVNKMWVLNLSTIILNVNVLNISTRR